MNTEQNLSQLEYRISRLETMNPFVPENFFSAKGELLTFTGVVPTLLSIGNDDEILVADSGETSGFIYKTISDIISGALLMNDGDILTVNSGLVALPVGTVNQYLGNDGTLLEWRDLPIINESSGLKANVAVDTIGTKAVMLQTEFSATTQSAKGNYSGLISGYRNSVASTASYATILGGSNNIVSSPYGNISGGNNNNVSVNSEYSAILNGASNTISNSSTNYYNLILIGGANDITNSLFGVIISGYDCTVTGAYSTILAGNLTTINANYSTAIGHNLDIDSNYTFVVGNPSSTVTFNRTNSFWIYDMVGFHYTQEYKVEDSELKNQILSWYVLDDKIIFRYKNSSGTVKTSSLTIDNATYMTTSIVGSNTATGTGTSCVLTKPFFVTNNTTLIAAISLRDNTTTVTAPAGWTLVNTGSRSNTSTRIYSKYVTDPANETTTYTWTLSGSAEYTAEILNVKNMTVSPVHTSNNNNGSSVSPSVASMTPSGTSSGMYLWFGHIPASGTTFSTPAGWTALLTVTGSTSKQQSYYKTFTSGTTSGVATSTLSVSHNWSTVGICLTANLF